MKSQFFSLLAGNLRIETGSTTTASATTHSLLGEPALFRAIARYSNIKLIVPHGGSAVPYLASRIARAGARPSNGPHRISPSEAMALLKSVYDDVTAMGQAANLALLREFIPADQLLVGYDYPFRPEGTISAHVKAFEEFVGFAEADKAKIRASNALRLFLRIAQNFNGR